MGDPVSCRREPKGSLAESRQPRDGQLQERPKFRFSNAGEWLRQLALWVDALAHAADQLGDHVDAVVHGLIEILGTPCALAEHDVAALDDRALHDGAPALACGTGGVW